MKFGKTTLFFILLIFSLLATTGMTIKEGLTSNRKTHTREKETRMEKDRSGEHDQFWSERRGVRRVDIPDEDQDLYVLKSSIVPPVCPKCPQSSACPRQKKCPSCPPCGRCPEPAFTCKKVPNYSSMNNQYLPLPWLSQS